jgi:hypothetical protein
MAQPGANANAGALGPAQVPLCYYRDYFTSPENDPFNDSYAEVLEPYRVPLANNNVLTSAQVRDLAINCHPQGMPTAFLLLHPDNRLHVYIQLVKFYTRMGRDPTDWDDQCYIQKGELVHNQSIMVEWDDAYFHQVNAQIRVPTAAVIDTTLAGDVNATILGPFTQADADTELIRVRRCCYVPPKYIHFFLANPLPPREAWEQVRGQIVVDTNEADCIALIDFFRAALVRSQANQPPVLEVALPTAPLADATLLNHRRRHVLERDFPALNRALPTLQQNQIATQLGVLVQENRTAREAAQLQKEVDKNKPLSSLLGEEGVATLLRIANVANELLLPPIWRRLANTKKAQKLQVLQHAVDEVLQNSAEAEVQFIVSAPILQLVLDMAFPMATNESVGTGLQPFMFPEQMPEEALHSRNAFEALYSGGSAPTAADLSALMKAKIAAPRYLLHTRHMIRRVEILLKVLFGTQHPLAIALEQFCNRFLSFEAELHKLEMSQPKYLLPTIICRRIALELSLYFKTRKRVGGLLPVPDFCKLYNDITLDNNWESKVPFSVLTQLGLPTSHVPAAHPPPAFAPAFQLPPQLPSPPPRIQPIGGQNGQIQRTRLNNTDFNAIFQQYRDLRSVRCSDLRQKIRDNILPALPNSKIDNNPMCLAWHVRGECNSACNRRADHVPYSAEEYAPMSAWCAEHFKAE